LCVWDEEEAHELGELNATHRQNPEAASVVYCARCGTASGGRWAWWRAYRVEDPELKEPPAIAFFCPVCAVAEFGPR
jgi:hypothetical protein